VVVGTVIGSGIFKKPQAVAQEVDQFGLVALVWVLGGVLALLGALALAEVAVIYPKAGGNYVFLREGYGRLAGFLWGWVEFWIIRGASLAALATVFSESVHDILRNPAFQQALGLDLGPNPLGAGEAGLTILVILGLGLVNIVGVRWGGLVQLLITTVKVGSLLAILCLPFLAALRADSSSLNWDRLALLGSGEGKGFAISGVTSALLGVLWAYHGWMNIAPVAEEIRQPQRNIPLALLAGVGIIIFLYLGANLAYALVIPLAEMKELKNTTVVAAFALRLLPSVGAVAASAAVMCSVFGALNGNLLVGPRLLYAMGEDGLAPRALGRVHPRFHTPALAIAVMAGWAAILVAAVALLAEYRLPVFSIAGMTVDLNIPVGKSTFNTLTDFAMFGAIIFETLAVASIFVFRRRLPDIERPYRCWGYPVVPLLYVAIMTGVVVNTFFSQRTEALVGMAFIAVGLGVYQVMERRRPRRREDAVAEWARAGRTPDDQG
jgi:amino acid transporter